MTDAPDILIRLDFSNGQRIDVDAQCTDGTFAPEGIRLYASNLERTYAAMGLRLTRVRIFELDRPSPGDICVNCGELVTACDC